MLCQTIWLSPSVVCLGRPAFSGIDWCYEVEFEFLSLCSISFQTLKFESYHDSALAYFLLERALKSKRIGHNFFWWVTEWILQTYAPFFHDLLAGPLLLLHFLPFLFQYVPYFMACVLCIVCVFFPVLVLSGWTCLPLSFPAQCQNIFLSFFAGCGIRVIALLLVGWGLMTFPHLILSLGVTCVSLMPCDVLCFVFCSFRFLRAEMDTPEYRERFGLLLEAYLRGCGQHMLVRSSLVLFHDILCLLL